MLYWYQQIISCYILVGTSSIPCSLHSILDAFWKLSQLLLTPVFVTLNFHTLISHFLFDTDLVSNVSYKCLAFKFLSIFLLHVELIYMQRGCLKLKWLFYVTCIKCTGFLIYSCLRIIKFQVNLCFHFCTHTLMKGMNPFLLPPANSSLD